MDLKHLDFRSDLKILDDDGDDDVFTIEGFGAVFGNVDEHEDVILNGAFTESLAVRTPIMLLHHDMGTPLAPIVAEERENGLFIRAQVPKALSNASDIQTTIRNGALGGLSVGMRVLDDDFDRKTGIRTIEKADLFEVSLVAVPANPMARVTSMKSVVTYRDMPVASVGEDWDVAHVIKSLREDTQSADTPSDAFRDAFLWVDASDRDEFSSYRFAIARVIDGEMTVIPKAVFAATAALLGARGKSDLSDKEISGITDNLEKYYAKMGRASPFKTGVPAFVVREGSLEDIDGMLKNGVHFAKSGADWIVKQISGRADHAAEGGRPDHDTDGQPQVDALERELTEKLVAFAKQREEA